MKTNVSNKSNEIKIDFNKVKKIIFNGNEVKNVMLNDIWIWSANNDR